MKRASVLRSIVVGFAAVALSACTSTTPAPESNAPTAAVTSASGSQASPAPTQTSSTTSASTGSDNQASAEPDFTANSIKILEHKTIEDPTGKDLQIKVKAPEKTSFFSGAAKAPCEASVIDTATAAPGSSISPSDPSVTYLLRCQDDNPTKELTTSIEHNDFHISFVTPLK